MRTNKVNDPENFEVPVVSGRPEPQAPEGRHIGLQKPFCTGDKTKWRGRPILRVLPKGGGRSREAKVQRLRSKNGECRIAKEEGAYAPIFPIRYSPFTVPPLISFPMLVIDEWRSPKVASDARL